MSTGVSTRMILGLAIGFAALAFAMVGSPSRASADTSDCPAADVCVWSGGTFGGPHEFFSGSETGCHSLSVIVHSARNHTGNHTATFGFAGESPTAPGAEIDLQGVTQLCIN
jgi:Peptidase inhibitor family I36